MINLNHEMDDYIREKIRFLVLATIALYII